VTADAVLRRLPCYLAWILGGALALVVGAWWLARPTSPDGFYDAPAGQGTQPGTLLRQEAYERGVPAGAQAWRILYATTRLDGTPAAASAIVMVSRGTAQAPRPVVAWTHGTTGVAPGCAPSLLEDPFAHVPALPELIDKGWIYVATDYVGLGTAGPHPYLVGEGEARSALDSIRALRQVKGLRAGDGTVVWGHSQGGHAALWTGILAPAYAPELKLLGVAAMAPASDLPSLVERVSDTPVGRIMSSFILRSYADAYPDVKFDAYASGLALPLAHDMAARCLAGREALFSVAESLLLGRSILPRPPIHGALGERLAQNTPDRPLPQPLLIAQGLADDLVRPEIQARFVASRCKAGQALEYRTYPGRDHLSLVAPDSPLVPDLVQWTQARFEHTPLPAACVGADVRQPAAADGAERRR
jgi:pimeloyl-ACP methyl ester carboxylesterase